MYIKLDIVKFNINEGTEIGKIIRLLKHDYYKIHTNNGTLKIHKDAIIETIINEEDIVFD